MSTEALQLHRAMGLEHLYFAPEGLEVRCAFAQTTAVFVKFLREASVFYALLTAKLQAAYGQLGFALVFPGMDDDLAAAVQRSALPEFKAALDCRISIYRCIICLGDLARLALLLTQSASMSELVSTCYLVVLGARHGTALRLAVLLALLHFLSL